MSSLRLNLEPERPPPSRSLFCRESITLSLIFRLSLWLPPVSWLRRFVLYLFCCALFYNIIQCFLIQHVMCALGDYMNIKVHACIGGTSIRDHQLRHCKRCPLSQGARDVLQHRHWRDADEHRRSFLSPFPYC